LRCSHNGSGIAQVSTKESGQRLAADNISLLNTFTALTAAA